jgi:hypothetical protein
MSLPLAWVDKIFDKLSLTYGQQFLNRWRDIDLNKVKSDWMHELSVFSQSPSRISFALSNLPEYPPSVIEFKNLCRQAPAPDVVALPEPPADPDRLRFELAKLSPVTEQMRTAKKHDPKAWARKIIAEQKAGIRKNPASLQMAKNALENT